MKVVLTLYIIAASIGGVLVLLSAVGGGDHDGDAGEIELDVEADAGVHGGGEAHGSAPHDGGEHPGDLWLSFFGMRFWTYFGAFFGLTGTLLTTLTPIGSVAAAIASVATGLVSGFGISTATRYLSKSQSTSNVQSEDLMGVEAEVLVPVHPERSGKVRLSLKGEVLDLPARAQGNSAIAAGTTVLIVGIEGHLVRVLPRDSVLPELAGPGTRGSQ